MNQSMFAFIILLVALVGVPSIAGAQVALPPSPPAGYSPNAPVVYPPKTSDGLPPNASPGNVNTFNTSAIGDQLAAMLINAVDVYIEYLARPQTTDKLAAFQKNYYDSLVKRGFTEEQAFQLVREFGNPLASITTAKSR
jgi:hypothetical protein